LPPNKFPYIPPEAEPDPGTPIVGPPPPGVVPGPGPLPNHQPAYAPPPPNDNGPPPPFTSPEVAAAARAAGGGQPATRGPGTGKAVGATAPRATAGERSGVCDV
jgi:phospholipid/cholesterol/gamma-HCH transport system substrate-binding protein